MLSSWMTQHAAQWSSDGTEGLFDLVTDALAALSVADAENVSLRRLAAVA